MFYIKEQNVKGRIEYTRRMRIFEDEKELQAIEYWPDSPKSAESAERIAVQVMLRAGATEEQIDAAFLTQ